MAVKMGYYISSVADGTIRFVRGGPKERLHGKIYTLIATYVSELPSRKLDKGSKILSFLHEPDDDVLGYQLMIEINKYVATKIPEITLKGVFIDRGATESESGVVNLLVVYDFENATVEDRFPVDTSMLGVT